MPEPESVRDGVLNIIRDYFKINDPINDETLIYHDLGIAGDDAGELLDEINAKFGAMFPGFDFHTYVPDDVDAFCYHIGKLFGIRDKRKGISFGHLVQVIEAGHWFEE